MKNLFFIITSFCFILWQQILVVVANEIPSQTIKVCYKAPSDKALNVLQTQNTVSHCRIEVPYDENFIKQDKEEAKLSPKKEDNALYSYLDGRKPTSSSFINVTRGFAGGSSIRGFAGGSSIRGFAGGSSIRGFAGGSSIRGFAGGSSIRGFAGGSSIRGFAGGSSIRGFAGGSSIRGFAGGSSIRGFAGGSSIRGFAGGSSIRGFAGGSSIRGFAGGSSIRSKEFIRAFDQTFSSEEQEMTQPQNEPIKVPKFLATLAPSNHTGLTVTQTPTFYWYIASPWDGMIEFTLNKVDADEPALQILIEPLKGELHQAGLGYLRLADYEIVLEPKQKYEWFLTIILDLEQRSSDLLANGTIFYSPASNKLKTLLDQTPQNHWYQVYAEEGIWYDAVDNLGTQILEQSPQAPKLKKTLAYLIRQAENPAEIIHCEQSTLNYY